MIGMSFCGSTRKQTRIIGAFRRFYFLRAISSNGTISYIFDFNLKASSGIPENRCQFIYLRAASGYAQGGQCVNEGRFVNGTLCHAHHNRRIETARRSLAPPTCFPAPAEGSGFLRVYTNEEIRAWVDEARPLPPSSSNSRPCESRRTNLAESS